MGQIRKINDVYYVEFHARGLLYSQLAGDKLEEAQKLLHQVEEKIACGEALTLSRHIELPDFFDRFLAETRERFGPRTVRRFECSIQDFCEFLKKEFPRVNRLDQLTPAVVESYKKFSAGRQKAKTVNLSILLIRDILEFGIRLRFINDNPALHVRLLPWPAPNKRRETQRYLQAARLLSQGVSLSKLAQLLKLTDITRAVYFADLIPLSREDLHG
jgi:hypothetical protein